MKGIIYIVRCNDFYKIGRTSNLSGLGGRLSSFNTGNPYKITLIIAAETEEVERIEQSLHDFADNGKHEKKGEWFKLCKESLDYIIKMIVQSTDFENPPFSIENEKEAEEYPHFGGKCKI